MPRLIWRKPDERTCCFSSDKEHFFGSYWKNGGKLYAHICPLLPYSDAWYIREFPENTAEKEIKKECQRLINHFKEEKDKWERD